MKTKEEFIESIVNDPKKIEQFPNKVGRKAYAVALWDILESLKPTDDIKEEVLKGKKKNAEKESESNVGRGIEDNQGSTETSESEES